MKSYQFIAVLVVVLGIIVAIFSAIPQGTVVLSILSRFVMFFVNLIVFVVMTVLVLLGGIIFGALIKLFVMGLLDAWLTPDESITNTQNVIAGIIWGLLVGALWVWLLPYVIQPWNLWLYNVWGFLGNTVFETPPVGWGIVAAIEAWIGYFAASAGSSS